MPRLNTAATRMRFAWTAARGWVARLGTDHSLRERALAHATFAAIVAFGAVAFDRILTGGADWNAGAGQAYAMAPASPLGLVAADPRETPPIVVVEEEAPPADEIVGVDFSFTTEVLLGGPDDPSAPDGYNPKQRELPHEEATLIAPLKPGAF